MHPAQLGNSRSKEEIVEQLIIEFEQYIKSLCYIHIRDWSTVEDITQEVFITCYEKLDNFRGESSYKTWLAKIAVNKCRDILKGKLRRKGTPSVLLTERLNFRDVSIDEQLIMKEKNNMLLKQVLSLSKIYREIIILYYFKELKMWEIENITGLNQDTIKSRLRRAKQQLRKKVKLINYF